MASGKTSHRTSWNNIFASSIRTKGSLVFFLSVTAANRKPCKVMNLKIDSAGISASNTVKCRKSLHRFIWYRHFFFRKRNKIIRCKTLSHASIPPGYIRLKRFLLYMPAHHYHNLYNFEP